ncbi:MAG: esterase-like activity of phytase family protein, partial [Rhodospirillaceae bacterium]
LATLTPADAAPIEVRTEPLALHTQDAAVRQVGSLVYRGGLVLASPEAAFGGFSALGVSADGRRLIAIGDRGRRLFAYLIYNENGDLAGLHRPELDSLAGLDGQPLEAKSESDAEAMSPGVEGEIIVAFERRHRLWRY